MGVCPSVECAFHGDVVKAPAPPSVAEWRERASLPHPDRLRAHGMRSAPAWASYGSTNRGQPQIDLGSPTGGCQPGRSINSPPLGGYARNLPRRPYRASASSAPDPGFGSPRMTSSGTGTPVVFMISTVFTEPSRRRLAVGGVRFSSQTAPHAIQDSCPWGMYSG